MGILIMDFGAQFMSVAFFAKIATIDPLARSRNTSVYMLANLAGGMTGTQISSVILLKHGWCMNGVHWCGVLVMAAIVCFLRGPHVPRYDWFGWKGGKGLRRAEIKRVQAVEDIPAADVEQGPSEESLKSQA